jgi:hypothetical protein
MLAKDPLKNQKHEDFCNAVVGGETPSKAYARLWGVNAKTASEGASRLTAKHANVCARIDFLRNLRAKIVEKATEKQINAAIRKIMVPLLTPTRRLALLAHFAETSQKDSDALTAIRMDAQLRGELVEKTDLTTDGEALPTALPSINLQLPTSFLERRNSRN